MSKIIDGIPPDVVTVMTRQLRAAFIRAGCDPACHCCMENIPTGSKFKLAFVGKNDEMLCDKCTAEKMAVMNGYLSTKTAAELRQRRRNLATGGSGYSRPHVPLDAKKAEEDDSNCTCDPDDEQTL